MKAILVLEDGTVFSGTSFGAAGEVAGELVFNTQVVGFQEILTDPAYRGKLVSIGYPHVGNYGFNDRCNESDQAHTSALIVKEFSKIYSNWQAKGSLGDFMKQKGVVGIEGIDTQAITVHLRDNGEMRAIVSTQDFNVKSLVEKAKAYQLPDLTAEVQGKAPVTSRQSKTVIINLGVNSSTLAKFPGAKVVSYAAAAEKILEQEPEQVVISSGPGDPTKLTKTIEEVKKLIGKVPLYGIQNGACVLALALGCSVSRMKVGHHGMNHPVVDPKTGQGEISAQNHSFGIDTVPANVKVMHVNLNDKSIEKIQTKDGSCIGTLYFPIDERGKLPVGYKLV